MRVHAFLAMILALSFPLTPEASEERLFITATNGDIYTLERLLDSGVDPNCYYTDTGNTPLHHAARAGQAAAVVALLKAGADPNARNNKIITPLHYADRIGTDQAILALLSGGADPNVPDINGNSALHQAAKQPDAKVVDALLTAGANPNTRNRRGQAALHIAAQHSHATLVGILLDAGGNLLAHDNEGKVPLHYAALAGSAETVSTLLASGSDPNVQDNGGSTPLHSLVEPYSANGSPAEVIALLVEAGADMNAKDNKGRTPVDIALSSDVARDARVRAAILASLLDPKCDGAAEGTECWNQVFNRAGCYVWDPYFIKDAIATWSGQCLGNVVHGYGEMVWTLNGEKYGNGTGSFASGKPHGEWIEHYYDGEARKGEGLYRFGTRTGFWKVEWRNGKVSNELF